MSGNRSIQVGSEFRRSYTEYILIRCRDRTVIQKIHPTMCRLSYESEDRFFAKQEIQYIDMTNAVFIRK